MSDENLNETLSMDDAVNMLVQPEPDGQTEEQEAETPEAVAEEVEAEAPEAEAEEAEAPEVEASEEGDDTPEEPDEDIYTVKVNGEEMEVPISELVKGYSRNEDYTRKTMAHAENERAFEAEKASMLQGLEAERQQLKATLEALSLPSEPEPDWVALAQTDPAGYALKRAQYDREQTQREQASELYQKIVQQDKQKHAETEVKALLDVMPEWRDQKVFQGAMGEITEAMTTAYGIKPEELSEIVDHRYYRIMNDAAKYQKLQAAKPEFTKKVVSAPKAVKAKGAAPKATKEARAESDMLNKVRKSGSVDDAVAWLTS